MNKVIRGIVATSMMLLVFSVADISAQQYLAAGAVRANTPVERQVFKKINGLPYYGVFDHISFEVKGSQVVLYGKVNSLGTRRDAERAVSRVPGVTSVVNNIVNLPPSPFDDRIRRSIVRSFENSGGLYMYLREPSPSVRIIVENGRVSLEGYVNNSGTANLMNILANQTPGVFKVKNNLITESARDR
ncbi:MAG: BON domain-containing protein [Pyrinomonadaceae bacterium]